MASSGWQVTALITDQVKVTDAGQTIVGTDVYFQTGDGNAASVFVADPHLPHIDRVHAAIEARADLVDRIARLSHDYRPA